MPFKILRQDITKMEVDVIVNAANTQLKMGGGVCKAIFNAAGKKELKQACDQLAPIKTGEAIITSGFKLPAKYIIHTAGPIYQDGLHDEDKLLAACYHNSLHLALEYNCSSIAFPLISSGIYGYPKQEAFEIASTTIKAFLELHDLDVYLVVFDKDAFKLSEQLLNDVATYINDNYVEKHLVSRGLQSIEHSSMVFIKDSIDEDLEAKTTNIIDIMDNLDDSFATILFKIIDSKNISDVEVYKKANIDRKLFSKIRSNKNYLPSKKTVLSLAIALELSLEETDNLLECAGYALSSSQKFDVIIEYFIINKRYDIYEINATLFKYDQPLLST